MKPIVHFSTSLAAFAWCGAGRRRPHLIVTNEKRAVTCLRCRASMRAFWRAFGEALE